MANSNNYKLDFGFSLKDKKLSWIQPTLVEWNNLLVNYHKYDNDPPYIFGERPSNSVLICAAARAGNIALAEYPTDKIADEAPRRGRADLYLASSKQRRGFRHISIETKQRYVSGGSSLKTFEATLKSACKDAREVRDIDWRDKAGGIFGCAYFVAKLPVKHSEASIPQTIKNLIDRAHEIEKVSAIGWSFPPKFRGHVSKDGSGSKFFWPGIIMVFRKAPFKFSS